MWHGFLGLRWPSCPDLRCRNRLRSAVTTAVESRWTNPGCYVRGVYSVSVFKSVVDTAPCHDPKAYWKVDTCESENDDTAWRWRTVLHILTGYLSALRLLMIYFISIILQDNRQEQQSELTTEEFIHITCSIWFFELCSILRKRRDT